MLNTDLHHFAVLLLRVVNGRLVQARTRKYKPEPGPNPKTNLKPKSCLKKPESEVRSKNCKRYCQVILQRWSWGHKARGQGQGHKKNPRPRPRTAFPRTDTLEAKDRNARGQGQGPRTQAQVLSKKKRSSQKFFKRSPQKNVFQKNFQALHKILTIQTIVLSLSRGQANFRGLEASRPRPRTSKCVLEDYTSVILIIFLCT